MCNLKKAMKSYITSSKCDPNTGYECQGNLLNLSLFTEAPTMMGAKISLKCFANNLCTI